MRFQSFKRIFGDTWAALERRQAKPAGRRHGARRKSTAQLGIEALETRDLLTGALPPLVVDGSIEPIFDQRDLTPFLGIGVNDLRNAAGPAIAVDPTDPNKLAAVWVFHDPNISGNQKYFVNSAYTIDGGQTWNTGGLFFQGNDPDPSLTPALPFAVVSNTSVAMDRNHNIYVTYIQHNPTQTIDRQPSFAASFAQLWFHPPSWP